MTPCWFRRHMSTRQHAHDSLLSRRTGREGTYIKPNIQLVLDIRRCHLPLQHRYEIRIIKYWPSLNNDLGRWFIAVIVDNLDGVVQDKVRGDYIVPIISFHDFEEPISAVAKVTRLTYPQLALRS